jgi:S1-C subfamily serine protease
VQVLVARLALGIALLADPPPPKPGADAVPPAASAQLTSASGSAPYCEGEYADDLAILLPRARELEQKQPAYTFCIRSTAAYDCPFYGTDGTLRRSRRRVKAHGTGFAYRQVDGGTLLLTNDHVAEWPAVTDEDHAVDGVPAGCKRVSDALKIVDSESDEYDPDDIPLMRVVVDTQLDVAIVKARTALPVMPWKIGRSAGLRERNAVNVSGFPLGVLKADNVGKVISVYDRDQYKDWSHDDFVVDALLSPGNSGSPVFAVSCKTGEFELVGIYHAAYQRGSALNVVVAIDQVRDLMVTLKRTTRPKSDPSVALDATSRARLTEAVRASLEPFFRFGALPAAVHARGDGALLFEVLSAEFPLRLEPLLVIEDLPPPGQEFGMMGRVWAGNRRGLKAYARTDLDGDSQGQSLRILDALRRDASLTFVYRTAAAGADGSKARFDQVARLELALRRASMLHQDLSQTVADLAERLGPDVGERAVLLSDALTVPPPPGPAPAPTPAGGSVLPASVH